MDYTLIFKALSNETRLQMLQWLKNPEQHFPAQSAHLHDLDFTGGICVGSLQDKAGLSQSTTSQYLSLLQRAGLLEAKRCGQWTYYRRNETAIQQLSDWIGREL
ncbi:ArsR family transcriptional regulator [Paenibacillus yonginensis]|uniref:ArsR family transcriptional regulator n=1 Tax=Paenibacillus yonginensis TaxID=1462996 RepID=A0A1B1MXL3_9BACL|nr:metalloregulator ArsR/SmtB family transcription factor [Paenibacillus yonginensis]ANS73914.1 ArsR family transcriptional regulator [Paenibacillus yonginensis]